MAYTRTTVVVSRRCGVGSYAYSLEKFIEVILLALQKVVVGLLRTRPTTGGVV